MRISLKKRVFDLASSFLLLIILSPLLIIVICVILLTDGYPVFYKQPRVGYCGRIFTIIKFRTMSSDISQDESMRVTRIGNVLRRTSIDEIPVLLNVLKGDMSMVGPRPLLAKYKSRYNEFQNRRHEVLPGITGLAQVNGRNSISWDEKFKYDVEYVDHYSFIMDIKILLKTLYIVFASKGINTEQNQIMPEFYGDELENNPKSKK